VSEAGVAHYSPAAFSTGEPRLGSHSALDAYVHNPVHDLRLRRPRSRSAGAETYSLTCKSNSAASVSLYSIDLAQ
jgi:hypothetical protein